MLQAMHILIISGLSGSGKSIALNLLEDAAYYCVDNLPPQLALAWEQFELFRESVLLSSA